MYVRLSVTLFGACSYEKRLFVFVLFIGSDSQWMCWNPPRSVSVLHLLSWKYDAVFVICSADIFGC